MMNACLNHVQTYFYKISVLKGTVKIYIPICRSIVQTVVFIVLFKPNLGKKNEVTRIE